MKIGDLKKLLDQFADDEIVVIANYDEDDGDGNMPCHEIKGAEYLPVTDDQKKSIVAIHFEH